MFAGRPLINYAIEVLKPIVAEILVVVGSEFQRESYLKNLPSMVNISIDKYREGSPLIGLITGLSEAKSEYAFVTACDMPFITSEPVELLFNRATKKNGAAFIKPDGWIEPLFAVYNVAVCLNEATRLFRAGDFRIRMVLRNLRDVEYIPSSVVNIDPKLLFFDIDTGEKLAFAEKIVNERK
jgi:molybdopterin-guanine dinucleotide biosynthesis protein A